MRIACWPLRSPFKASSRLPGGILKSSSRPETLSSRSFRSAASWRSEGKRRLRRPAHILSVSRSAKLRITIITYNVMGIGSSRGCLSSDRCETGLQADRGSLKLVFRHPSLRRPPMKVFSLQAPIYRGAWLSSRLTAQTSQLAAVRRDALERWRRARSRGLSAEEAARAVGASRASLYRWEKRLEPRSRRPHRQRQPTWTRALMRKIERLRAED